MLLFCCTRFVRDPNLQSVDYRITPSDIEELIKAIDEDIEELSCIYVIL